MFGGYDWQVFGVSWVAVGAVLLALLRRYVMVSEEGVKLSAAFYVVAGYFVNALWVSEQWVLPTMAEQWVGLVLQAILIFGAVLGLTPGDTAGKVYRATIGKIGKKRR